MTDEGQRAGDEKKQAIDITERYHRKLVSPERRHVHQLETQNLGPGGRGCI